MLAGWQGATKSSFTPTQVGKKQSEEGILVDT
jgi:hypothetical protein